MTEVGSLSAKKCGEDDGAINWMQWSDASIRLLRGKRSEMRNDTEGYERKGFLYLVTTRRWRKRHSIVKVMGLGIDHPHCDQRRTRRDGALASSQLSSSDTASKTCITLVILASSILYMLSLTLPLALTPPPAAAL